MKAQSLNAKTLTIFFMNKLIPFLVLCLLLSGCTEGPFESSDQPTPAPLPEPKLLSENLEFVSYETRTAVVGAVQNEELKELMEEMDDLLAEKAEEMGVEVPAGEGEEVTYHDLDLKFFAEVENEGAAGEVIVSANVGLYPSTEETVVIAGDSRFVEIKSVSETVSFGEGEKKVVELEMKASIREDLLVSRLAREQFDADSILDLVFYGVEVEAVTPVQE